MVTWKWWYIKWDKSRRREMYMKKDVKEFYYGEHTVLKEFPSFSLIPFG